MNIEIRPLRASELADADRIFRQAFGTFLGLPDPMAFMGDADLVTPRWRTAPNATLGAFRGNELVGSNFLAHWGSFGFFGPLTVVPELWGSGIAKQLLAATVDRFEQKHTRHVALFTFPHSPIHLGLYQKFGFRPHYLTVVQTHTPALDSGAASWTSWSSLPDTVHEDWAARCRTLTETIYPGLDVQGEIDAVNTQKLGDTVLIHQDGQLSGFAICHVGAGTEAGSNTAYVKFGAVQPGGDAARRFKQLLCAIDALARDRGVDQVVAGVNTARTEACGILHNHGFKTALIGVAMQRPNEPGYNRPDCFVMDDLR